MSLFRFLRGTSDEYHAHIVEDEDGRWRWRIYHDETKREAEHARALCPIHGFDSEAMATVEFRALMRGIGAAHVKVEDHA